VSDARVLTQPLGGSSLAALAIQGNGSAFFPDRPPNADAWRARMNEVRATVDRGWLSAIAPAIAAGSTAAARLERVAQGRGVLVTTGQQPGLFGGPVYIWAKAISALALADALETATGVPTAPLFWAATDDADYAEASVTYVATRAGLRELRLRAPVREGVSMAHHPLGEMAALVDEMAAAAGSAPYDEPMTAVREAYADEATIGDAYVAFMRRMLEPLGIAVLDASHAAVRRASRPLLAKALRRAPEIDASLRERELALRAAGYEPQVTLVRDLSLVFEYAGETKRRVPLSQARDVDDRAELGPNVLLRPVVERSILPTVAYMAGPGELAYFAQVAILASALEVPSPLGVPRWSGLIVEPYVERILHRFGLAVDDIRDPHAVIRKIVAERMPSSVARSLSDVREAVHRAMDAVRAALVDDEPSLVEPRVVEGAEYQLQHRVDRFERRVLAAAKRRETAIVDQVIAAHASLFPLGRAQERCLNFVPMLARSGPTLIDSMIRAAGEHAAALAGPSAANVATAARAAPITS
jgi:bacillithiol biosynthesis cysteine-adding enzyme BshC